ncbi:MAG: DUF58 domain-containing protein [Armatimonadota bacterium]|nr:DUF58 domain-containing protein [Armatimonadota bacterium]
MSYAINWQRVVLLLAAVGFLFAAVVMRLSFFAFALYALGAVSLVAYLMTWSALDGLATERHVTGRDAEIGDDVVVTVPVRNDKPLPTIWLVAEDILPRGLEVAGTWARAVLLMPFASMRLQYRLRCSRRGYFRVGPVMFETGDFFGLTRRFATGSHPTYLTVYPRVVPLEQYAIPTSRPMGETVVKRRMVEDPTRLAGVREYRTGDPLRRIHWKATASTGELHSRVYEYSTLVGANIILDFGRAAWDGDRARSELAVTAAASIASHLTDRKQQVGLVTNGGDASDIMPEQIERISAPTRQRIYQMLAERERTDRLSPVRIPVRRGEHNLHLIMRSLARLRLSDALTLPELITEEYEGWPREATALVIAPGVSRELLPRLVELRNSGFTVACMIVANEANYGRVRGMLESEGIRPMHVGSEEEIGVIGL